MPALPARTNELDWTGCGAGSQTHTSTMTSIWPAAGHGNTPSVISKGKQLCHKFWNLSILLKREGFRELKDKLACLSWQDTTVYLFQNSGDGSISNSGLCQILESLHTCIHNEILGDLLGTNTKFICFIASICTLPNYNFTNIFNNFVY